MPAPTPQPRTADVPEAPARSLPRRALRRVRGRLGAVRGTEESTGPSTLRAVGPHFVIAAADDHGLTAALAGLRADPQTLVLVAAAADAAPVLRAHLAELARTAAERGAGALVLAASGLAAAPAGGPRPAERVAEQAGLPVVAPDGLVSIRPDGTLLATGSWWRCPPGGTPERLGELWPPPEPLPAPEPPLAISSTELFGPDGPLLTPLPSGCWLRSDGEPAGFHSTALEGVSAEPDSFVLVVGHPAAPLLPADHLVTALTHLAPPNTGLLLSAPWSTPVELVALAAELAARLGRDVRAAVGLPMRTADGRSARLLHADGRLGWEPFLVELTASADRHQVVASAWRSRPEHWTPCGPAQFSAPPDWQLEAVPAGLWLRPQDPQDCAPRQYIPDAARPLLVVGEQGRPVGAQVWEGLGELLAGVPPFGDVRLGLLVAGTTDAGSEAVARFSARLHKLDWTDPQPQPELPTPAPEPAPEPEPEPAPLPAPPLPTPPPAAITTGPVPTPASPAHTGTSTPAEREALRSLLGDRFQRLASRADQAGTRLPSLRSSLQDDLKPDLVAVLLHHLDAQDPASRAELARAARSSTPGPLTPVLACLGSGLRRLPSHHGAVLLGADAGPEELRHYTPGAILTEPAALAGFPSHEVALGAPVEFAVWSTTGRRTAVFAAPGEEPEVVFAPGTRFTVLALLPADDEESAPARVLLRELGTESAEQTADERDQQTCERLLGWLARRDTLPTAQLRPPTRPTTATLTPGIATTR